MGIINVLDKQTANLIAAGEVVERPASAIKELLENCADAGATKVTVEIKNGGTTYIRVTDNGCGMAKEDLSTCILRHATSKIKTKEDLSCIGTLGFRGEALAAIAAVTRLSIMTKRACDSVGYLMESEFGTVNDVTEAGCADGTTIIARNLFENVPARRKFLKRDATEAHAVVAAVEKFALSKPAISVNCISDGIERLKTPGDGVVANTIYAALGREFSEGMIKIDYSFGGIEVSGYVCKPSLCRPNRSMQNFFINQRYVRSKTMCAALEEGFRSFCPTGKYPGAVMYLSIENALVDVNIHPAKLEVKFVNEKAVFETVFYAVRNALSRATNGSTLLDNTTGSSASISQITKAFPPENSSSDKGYNADSAVGNNKDIAEVGNIFFKEKGSIVEISTDKVSEDSKGDCDKNASNADTGVASPPLTEIPQKKESRSLEEIARIFDSEKQIGEEANDENGENGDNKASAVVPPAEASSKEHLDFIHKLDISIPKAPEKYGIDFVHEPPPEFKADKLFGEVKEKTDENNILSGFDNSDYFKGIAVNTESKDVSQAFGNDTANVVNGENPDNIPDASNEPRRPQPKPLEQTISMLDADDDGTSAINTKSELEKRIKRGVNIIGEAFNAYIIVETGGDLYLVDKHAAHERIIYEGMKNGLKKREGVQLLLEPLNVSVSSKEAEAITEHGDYIKNAGFVFEEFGHNSYLLRGLPPLVDLSDGIELFAFLAGRLADGNGRALGDVFDRALYTAACKAAVKAGRKTSELSNTVIIDKLFSDEGVLYCPHGRPVLIKFTKSKLDRMFGRT